MKPILEMKNVTVKRGSKLVLNIKELTLAKGELVSLIGPNGCGKSTLLQTINLLLPISSGQISLYGEETGHADKRQLRQRSGLVFQEVLFTKDTVFDNVALPLRLRGIPKVEIAERVAATLEMFRCSHLINRHAHHLSGGEAQRVSLARALVCKPELLLLDEPFTALDPATRHGLIYELKQIAQDQNTTVLLISHTLGDVLHFTKRAIVMESGGIVQDDEPEAVLRRPATLSVAKLIGMDNILPCKLVTKGNDTLVKLSEDIQFTYHERIPEKEAFCCLPGDIFYFNEDLLSENKVQLDVKVRQIIPGIGVYRASVDAPGLSLNIRVSRKQAGRHLKPGAEMRVAFDPQEAQIV